METNPTMSESNSNITLCSDESALPLPTNEKQKDPAPWYGYLIFFLLGIGSVSGFFTFVAALDFYKK